MIKSVTRSEKQTFDLGIRFAKKLQGGEIIGLIGNLGAGKTIFIKGLAKGLGIKQTITSPTFVLMKIYKINKRESETNLHESQIQWLCHIDAYRLKSSQDLIDIGIEDYLKKKNTVTVIEWAEKVRDILPKNAIFVKITIGKKINQRTIKIKK